MLKKILACSVVSLFVLGGIALTSIASDNTGPEEITLVDSTSAKPKPAYFPHKKHQEALKCAECHHGMADGKRVEFVEGQEIKQCASCHNAEVLAGKTKGSLKLDSLKGAGHGNCLECHKEMAKNDPALKEKKIDKCDTCHKKA